MYMQYIVICGLMSIAPICSTATNEGSLDDIFHLNNNEWLVEKISENLVKRENAFSSLKARIPDLNWIMPHFQFHSRNNTYKIDINIHSSDVNQCDSDLLSLAASLTNKDMLPLIDSYGKPPSGISKGAVFWPGSFDECQSFEVNQSKSFPMGFKGRYCLLQITPESIPLAINTGICIPRSCNSEILNSDLTSLKNLLKKIPFMKQYIDKIPKIHVNCLPETVSLSPATITCIFILALFAGLALIGTSYDLYSSHYKTLETSTLSPAQEGKLAVSVLDFPTAERDIADKTETENDKAPLVELVNQNGNKWISEVILSFSIIKNGKSIFDTTAKKGQLNCLHGIRFISITWVIVGHVYVFGMNQFGNVLDLMRLFNTWNFQAIANATFSVDTFFLLSGFLLTYLFLKDQSPFTLKKLGSFYMHRYIRLTPVYMAVLFAYSSLFNFIGDGPYWNYANQESNLCTKYWWRNILYVNNFASVSDMCMGWSWYLSNDMQFFLISPLFLVFFKSTRKKMHFVGVGIIAVLLLSSWITTGVITKVKNLAIMFEGLGDVKNVRAAQTAQYEEFDLIYDKPYTRIGPYLIGCLLGYAFIYVDGAQKFLKTNWIVIGWCSAFALGLTDVYGLYNAHLGIITSSFYNALGRSAWSLSVSWVIYACLTGHGGPINKFLSWKAWFPLSRLTYCAYLTHPLVMYFYFQTLRTPLHLTNVVVAVHFLGFVALTYGVALITSLLFEAPIMKLEKCFKKSS